MKTLTTFLSIFILTGMAGYAQSQDSGHMNATIHKTFSIEKDGTEVPYNLKVMEHRNYPMVLKQKEMSQVNQNRKEKPAVVTKLIAVDKDNDQNYDHYMVLKYRRSVTDSFKVVPTKKGFAVKVDDKTMQYFVTKGIYFIDNTDKDFFSVEEFREI
ncbi:hypothetical protein EZV76_01000 [Flagellimonas alvinocaridis]|uniref:Uncharacterized protein n=1 Tax=Flagellimonas alvinocaridis TaxID=2530200 RepID=A0A4S8RSH7_9FLAO|nr:MULTISPECIES: hypothetical protein [Allomuricauda]THV60942.1 hypothetical protein EZV76_01000 [Allomuricauda alvinocaridis]